MGKIEFLIEVSTLAHQDRSTISIEGISETYDARIFVCRFYATNCKRNIYVKRALHCTYGDLVIFPSSRLR